MSKLPLAMIAALMVSALTAPQTATATPIPATQPTPPQSHDGMNRRVRIHNQTGWTLVRFQTADARSRAWQDGVLEARTIATGASWVATIDDGSGACVYVFRAEFSNGQALERAAINVCEIADYYYTR
ncbi:hypothetical protein BH10PSE1_BH10PSE1_11750 [soil metagenome]